MKKWFIYLMFLSSQAYSQSLNNTIWSVYTKNNSFSVYARFLNDTLSFSNDKISYAGSSSFTVSANNFLIRDFAGPSCGTALGQYTFSIKNDTLDFKVTSDPCLIRSEVIADFYWVRLHSPTDIREAEIELARQVFPNPTSGRLNIGIAGTKRIQILNLQGEILNNITTDSNTIFLEDLAAGLYILKVFDNDNSLLGHCRIICEK